MTTLITRCSPTATSSRNLRREEQRAPQRDRNNGTGRLGNIKAERWAAPSWALHMTAGKGYSSEGIRSPLALLTFSVLKYFFSEEVSRAVYCVVLKIIRCFPEKHFSILFKDSEIVYASMRLPAWWNCFVSERSQCWTRYYKICSTFTVSKRVAFLVTPMCLHAQAIFGIRRRRVVERTNRRINRMSSQVHSDAHSGNCT